MEPGVRRRRAVLATAIGLVVAALVAWLLLRSEPTPDRTVVVPPAAPTPTPAPVAADPCLTPPPAAFVPTAITVEGVARNARVLALPRDAAGVVGVPPVADKTAFAWDEGGVEPGSAEGHVLLNTHTWPDGSAMGNRLLRGLDVGGRVLLSTGKGGSRQVACYAVTERTEVLLSDGYPGWDAVDGPPQVVIVVCSGKRLGPGNWTHRTLWFANPVAPA